MNAKKIYEKCLAGEEVTNEELEYAIKYFDDLEEKLNQLGPVFHLSWKEIARILNYLQSCKFARSGWKDL